MNWKHENGRMYCIDENGELMAETTYVLKGRNEAIIDHTYVNPALRGQGIAGKMMEAISEFFRENKLNVSATCSYADVWLKNHGETFSDSVSEETDAFSIAFGEDEFH